MRRWFRVPSSNGARIHEWVRGSAATFSLFISLAQTFPRFERSNPNDKQIDVSLFGKDDTDAQASEKMMKLRA
jgi:hypothetical protein